MANKDNKNLKDEQHISTSASLGDEQRVRVLSPSMLVIKRFFRNRLAVIGLITIAAMFVFSFIGPYFSPYGEIQQFMKVERETQTYAGATYNTNYYYTTAPGYDFDSIDKAAFVLAANNRKDSFTSAGSTYHIKTLSQDDTYLLGEENVVADFISLGDNVTITPKSDASLPSGFNDAAAEAVASGADKFVADNTEYHIFSSKRSSYIYTLTETVLLTKDLFNPYAQESDISFELQKNSELAMTAGETSFEADGVKYTLEYGETKITILRDGEPFADISNLIVTSAAAGRFISIPFRDAVEKAIVENAETFTMADESGEEIEYTVIRRDMEFTIQSVTEVDLLDTYASPSLKHWVGTNGAGMDMLTRLMYGGRISLSIGFVVILIEMVIGVIMGGISGYFGGIPDTIIMRIVDTMNCIPTLPLYIILGTIMGTLKIDPTLRIYLLMVVLGITGWTGIARVVRGQILSLREQEFMLAEEALGMSTRRRIFHHLIPNVIPQLIVYATMGLGSVILTEATLSFLNLGVKYPYASWGNIVNAVNDSYVLTNYTFAWIPAGLLILITVLGFNFIGDGLRDAFDPKMKR